MPLRKIWLPATLYQILPLAYLVSGSLMLAGFGHEPMGLLSGLLLCAAAVLIWCLRIYAASKGSARKR